MKRVLVAVALGGLLLVGTPTLALSAQRSSTQADKGDNKGADNKGGDHSNRGGDNKGGDKADHGDRGDRGDRGDHRGDRDGDRYGHRYGYGYGYPGYYYGDPYDCYYGRSGAYNCEEYGGDYDWGGYNGAPGPGAGTVVIRGHAFNPRETHVRPGNDVTWAFQDGDPHTVTADNNSFDSGKRNQGEFRLTFDQPGTYSYHCAIHPDMRGRVVVG